MQTDSRLTEARLLIVDDEAANVALLTRVLHRAGFTRLRSTTDSRAASDLFDEWKPDLVILDLRMPHLDGFAVLAQLGTRIAPTDYVPVLAITGDTSTCTRERVIAAGARDYLEKPFRRSEVLVRVRNLLTTRFLHRSLQQQNELLEQKVRERTAELEVALSAAEAAIRAKSRFLAAMSHELRTPLNAVIGLSGVLRQNRGGNLTSRELVYVERIADNGTRLLNTIDEVLDLSRVETGKIPLEIEQVLLDELLPDLVAKVAASSSFAGKQLSVRCVIPPDPRPLATDPGKLRQILMNLLENAVKFTDAGSVVLGLCCGANGAPLRIDVVDTGVGVSPDRMGVIFDAFEQEDNSTQRRFGGSGLGLAIVRALSELLGFRVSVASDLGIGAGFTVLLDDRAQAPSSYSQLAATYLEAAV